MVTHSHTHTYTYTHINTYTHTHIHTFTYPHIHTCTRHGRICMHTCGQHGHYSIAQSPDAYTGAALRPALRLAHNSLSSMCHYTHVRPRRASTVEGIREAARVQARTHTARVYTTTPMLIRARAHAHTHTHTHTCTYTHTQHTHAHTYAHWPKHTR